MKPFKLRPLIAATLIALATPVTAVALGTDKDDQTHLAYAMAHEDGGRIRAALIEYKTALQQNPGNLSARWRLGRLYLRDGDLDTAQKELSIAVGRGSRRPEARLALAEVHLRRDQYQQVLDILAPDFGDDPRTRARTLALRGSALAGLQRFDAARQALDRALEHRPGDVGALLGLVYLARFSGDDAAVDGYLEQARITAPRSRRVWQTSADIALARGDFQQAAEAYARLLELDPEASAARLGLAQARIHQARPDRVNGDLDALLSDTPNHPQVLLAAAVAAYAGGNPTGANHHLAVLLAAEPEHAEALLLGAAADYDTGMLESGLQRVRAYLSLQPQQSGARRLLVALLIKAGSHPQATEQLDVLLQHRPDDRQVHLLAAHNALALGDGATARDHLAALPADPLLDGSATDADTTEALTRLDAGDLDGAAALVRRLTLSDRRAGLQSLVGAAATSLQQGDFDRGLEQAEALVGKVPDSADLRNLLGVAQLGRGDRDAARESFRRALQLNPEHRAAAANRVQLDLVDGRFSDARATLIEWLDQEPGSHRAMLLMAGVAAAEGNSDEAADWRRRALRSEVDANPASDTDKVRQLLAAGDVDGALTTARRLHGEHRDDPQVLRVLAGALAASGDSEAALARLQDLTELAPEQADHWVARSLAQQQAGDNAAAEQSLLRVLELNPGHAGATQALVRIAAADGRYERALELAAELTRSQPDSPLGAALEGDVRQAMDDRGGAESAYRRVLQRDPSEANALRLFGFLSAAGPEHRAEAIDFLRHWSTEHPDHHQAGVALAMHGADPADAAAAYHQALGLQPDNPALLNELALLYQRDGDLEQALEHASRAFDHAPTSPLIADTLGWVLWQLGDEPQRSEALLTAAARALPGNAEVHYHLAQVWADQGRSDAAKQHLTRVLDSGRHFAEEPDARALLAELSGS